MDSQGQEIAEATVIGGDYRLGGVYFEKFVYGSEEGWSEGFGYCRLSVVLTFEVFDKAGEDEAQGILVVPDWLGSMMAREIEYCEQLGLVARWSGGQEAR